MKSAISIGVLGLILGFGVGRLHSQRSGYQAHAKTESRLAFTVQRFQSRTLSAGAAESAHPFHWAELNGGDYADYIGRLRAIGCPVATIHDIIEGDLSDAQFELDASGDRRHWEYRADTLTARQEQHCRLLLMLFALAEGRDPDKALETETYDAVRRKFDIHRRVAAQWAPDTTQLMQRLKEIEDSELMQLATIIDEEALRAFRATNSIAAKQLAYRIRLIRPTSEELAEIYAAEQEPQQLDRRKPLGPSLEPHLDAESIAVGQLQGILGKTRFDDYLLTKRYGFSQLAELADKHGLTLDQVRAVFQLTDTVNSTLKKFEAMERRSRTNFVQGVREELASILGPGAYEELTMRYFRLLPVEIFPR